MTIAKLVAEIGGDPTGLTQALKRSTGSIEQFAQTTTREFEKIGRGTDLGQYVSKSIAKLKSQLTNDLGRIREDVFRGVISPEEATNAGVEAATQFNDGLFKTINSLANSGRKNIDGLRAKLSAELLATGVKGGQMMAEGIRATAIESEVAAEAHGVRAGRSFAQTLTATIHRHRALIPTLAGLLLSQFLGSASEFASGENKMIQFGKAAERIIENVAMLASFLLEPIPGLIAAVVGGSIAAIIGIFVKAKENMAEFRKGVKKELDGLINDVDQIGLQKRLKEIEIGRPAAGRSVVDKKAFKFEADEKGFFKSGLNDLLALQKRDVADLRYNVTAASRDIVHGGRKALADAIEARKPLIVQAEEQQKRIRDALLHPLGGETGFGGQLPAEKSTATSTNTELKKFEELYGRKIQLFKEDAQASRLDLALLDDLSTGYFRINRLLMAQTDQFSDQAVSLRKLRDEYEELLKVFKKLGDAGVQFAEPARPKIVITPDEVVNSTRYGRDRVVGRGSGLYEGAPQTHITELDVAMSQLRDSASQARDAIGRFAVAISQRIIGAIIQRASPLQAVLEGVSKAGVALERPFLFLANVVGASLKPVFDALVPVIRELTPIVATILQIVAPLFAALAPLLRAVLDLIKPLLPVLKLVAIVFTYVGQASATLAGVILKIAAALVNGVGGVIKALGTIISKIPFLGGVGRDIRDFGQDILNFGNGLNSAGKDMFDAATAFADARNQIKAVDVNDTSKAIQNLGNAANAVAGVLNGPNGFKVEILRYMSQDATKVFQPGDTSGASSNSDVVINGNVNIDAKGMTRGQLFEMVREEARAVARARFGNSSRAAEAFA